MNQYRICSTKLFHPSHENEYTKIQNSGENKDKLSAAFYTKKLWPVNSIIRIKFLQKNPTIPRTSISDMDTQNGPIDPLQQYFFDNPSINITDAIKKIVNERIQPLVSLNLQFVDENKDADVRIDFDSDGGSWSLLGTDVKNENPKNATVNFGWFDVSTVMHEFGHVLGMIHEHQNPKGKTIDWNYDSVYEWAESTQGWDKEMTKKNILNRYKSDSINGSDFDPLSIMLYFFPSNLTNNGVGTHQNLRLSGTDMTFITKNYGINDPAKIYKDIYKTKYRFKFRKIQTFIN